MQLDKQAVVDFIEHEAGASLAREAMGQLPEPVDHERHGDLLRQFGVDPLELIKRLGGVPGDGPVNSDATSRGSGTEGAVTGTEDDYESGDGPSRTRARV
jgi:hypothetical protein